MDGKRRGRGGFLKGKLMRSLYRSTVTHKSPSSSTTVLHLPYAADHGGYVKIPAHQLSQLPTHTRSVSYYYPPPTTDITNKKTATVDSYSAANMDTVYGGIAVDDEVDRKAANYISSVRERFRLDYLN